MPGKVTLKVVEGCLDQPEYVFPSAGRCVIGRAPECFPHIPPGQRFDHISRRHCELDIDPPAVVVRDLGSTHGTFVNRVRVKPETPVPGEAAVFRGHPIRDGDEIMLGDSRLGTVIVFRVTIEGESRQGEAEVNPVPTTTPWPETTATNGAVAAEPSAGLLQPCTLCRREFPVPREETPPAGYVCAACRETPLALARQLLAEAECKEDLAHLRGYELVRELGRGGMGAVFLLRRLATREELALKLMLPRVAVSARAVGWFRREVENMLSLNHPQVARGDRWGCHGGVLHFTMEYCAGGNLARFVEERGGRLPLSEAVSIVNQILDGLEYTHRAVVPHVELADGSLVPGCGLVHRDLKPGNIFLSDGSPPRVKIGDYGLAKAFELAGISGQTDEGESCGTPHFMPRRQLENFRRARPEVDVWAAAASLYWMLTGFTPRDFPADADLVRVVWTTAPRPIRERDASLPARLAAVIDAALAEQNGLRFATAAEFKHALAEAL